MKTAWRWFLWALATFGWCLIIREAYHLEGDGKWWVFGALILSGAVLAKDELNELMGLEEA